MLLFCVADRYQVSGIRQVLDTDQYLHCCLLFSGLSAIMRVQYASCSRSNLCVYCKLLSAAMPYIPLLMLLLLLLLCYSWGCCWVCPAAAAAAAAATAAAAVPATTLAAAVAPIFYVVLQLLSLSCVGEVVSSAQAPLEVCVQLALERGDTGYWVLGNWAAKGQQYYGIPVISS